MINFSSFSFLILFFVAFGSMTSAHANDSTPSDCRSLSCIEESNFNAMLSAASTAELHQFISKTENAKGSARDNHKKVEFIFAELARRNAVTTSDWKARLSSAYKAGDWLFAEHIQRAANDAKVWDHSNYLSYIPQPDSPSKTRVWAFDFSRQRLIEESIDFQEGLRFVVVFHPLCGFCAKAARAIEAHAELRAVFKQCGIWTSFHDTNFSVKRLEKWQHDYPNFKVRMIKDWAAFDLEFPEMFPVIHVYSDSVLIASISGWPEEGRIEELSAFIKKYDKPQLSTGRTCSVK